MQTYQIALVILASVGAILGVGVILSALALAPTLRFNQRRYTNVCSRARVILVPAGNGEVRSVEMRVRQMEHEAQGGLLPQEQKQDTCYDDDLHAPSLAERLSQASGALADINTIVTSCVAKNDPPRVHEIAEAVLKRILSSSDSLHHKPGYYRHEWERIAWENYLSGFTQACGTSIPCKDHAEILQTSTKLGKTFDAITDKAIEEMGPTPLAPLPPGPETRLSGASKEELEAALLRHCECSKEELEALRDSHRPDAFIPQAEKMAEKSSGQTEKSSDSRPVSQKEIKRRVQKRSGTRQRMFRRIAPPKWDAKELDEVINAQFGTPYGAWLVQHRDDLLEDPQNRTDPDLR